MTPFPTVPINLKMYLWRCTSRNYKQSQTQTQSTNSGLIDTMSFVRTKLEQAKDVQVDVYPR